MFVNYGENPIAPPLVKRYAMFPHKYPVGEDWEATKRLIDRYEARNGPLPINSFFRKGHSGPDEQA